MNTVSTYMNAPVYNASFDIGASQIKNASSDSLGKIVDNFGGMNPRAQGRRGYIKNKRTRLKIQKKDYACRKENG
ncbi:MAG: hypothetical protein K8S18_16475 [Desulfobacula sp.]|nr:hypothetical protein [Desulfobacula sp.]